MKFSQETGFDGYAIHAYNEKSVTIIGPPAGERSLPSELILEESFILTPMKLIREWPPLHSLPRLQGSSPPLVRAPRCTPRSHHPPRSP